MMTEKDEKVILVFFCDFSCQKKDCLNLPFSIKSVNTSVLYVIKNRKRVRP